MFYAVLVTFTALAGVFIGVVWERYAQIVMSEYAEQAATETALNPKRLISGFYKHHKGGLYLALVECRNSETGEDGILYLSLSPPCVGNFNWRPFDGPGGWYTPTDEKRQRFVFQRPCAVVMKAIQS